MEPERKQTDQPNPAIIRFGIMAEGTSFPRWQAEAITSLINDKRIECRLLILKSGNWFQNQLDYLAKKLKFKNIFWLIFSLYLRIVSKATRKINLAAVLNGVPVLACKTSSRGHVEYLNQADIKEIKSHQLDFILRFSFGIIKGEILKSAKYGVWSFHHGDQEKYRGGPACFWEIYYHDKVTGAILQKLTDRLDAGVVLRKAFFRTSQSYLKNRDQLLLAGSEWPLQVCRDILNKNSKYLDAGPVPVKSPIFHLPTNRQFIRFFFVAKTRGIFQFLKKALWVSDWNIGVVNQSIGSFLVNPQPEINWFPNNQKGRYLADPLVVASDDKLVIFFENFDYQKSKGSIAFTSYQNGSFLKDEKIIEESFHLSYPFVFKHKKTYFMIPESRQASKVILYRAINFPLSWQKERVLLKNFAGVDNTLFSHQGTCWLFSSDGNSRWNSNLYLFYSKSLFGSWKPHPQNPVKLDVRSSRSAGPIFSYKGKLYRPSIDCSEEYGRAITINEILSLTKTDYKEIEFQRLTAQENSEYPDGIHTLSGIGGKTIIDGYKKKLVFKNADLFWFNLNRTAGRLRRIISLSH